MIRKLKENTTCCKDIPDTNIPMALVSLQNDQLAHFKCSTFDSVTCT